MQLWGAGLYLTNGIAARIARRKFAGIQRSPTVGLFYGLLQPRAADCEPRMAVLELTSFCAIRSAVRRTADLFN